MIRTKCATCPTIMQTSRASITLGMPTCRPCRSIARQARRTCECGALKSMESSTCRACAALRQTIRSEDDARLERHRREAAAPGLNPARRASLLDRWRRQGKRCLYCSAAVETVDHVVPLVRGGTNMEGNLAPACRSCNSRKGGLTIIEWRSGRRMRRMVRAVEWTPKPKPFKIQAIRGEQVPLFSSTCPACGTGYPGNAAYCSDRCRMRTAYRMSVGIPITAKLYAGRAA